jgi:hypothetical protein
MDSTLRPEPQQPPVALPEPQEQSPLVIERFLRDREQIWRQVYQEYRLNTLIRQMLMSSTVALACYGLVLGISQSVWQALSSAVKLPILFLLTTAICLPTLYLFNLLLGGRLSVRQVLALSLSAITVTSALTLAFAPIALFFLITAQGYYFYVLLNVAILTLTGVIGLQFLVGGSCSLNALSQADKAAGASTPAEPAADAEKPADMPPADMLVPDRQPAQASAATPAGGADMRLLYIWLALYAFVGTQLGWTLRPFFGSPNEPFALFRSLEGNFYEAIMNILITMASRL